MGEQMHGRPVTVDTKNGKMRGEIIKNTAVFKGIPYARPPVGELRFAPPQPPEPWDGVRDCLHFGHCATQEPTILVNTTPSEDCLYLNIFSPEDMAGKSYPVYFWIHGGGFFNGCGSMNYYDGTAFAKNGIILVTINYRLGALGFLALGTLLKRYGTTGNWGTLDQIAALKWVKENIAAFGGDGENITVGGESAGSFSVSNLVLSPLASGLFKRAIMQSGSLLSNPVAVPFTRAGLQASIDISREFAAAFGADDSEAGIERLRSRPAMELWRKGFFSSDVTVPAPLALWPVLDGAVLPKDPVAALKDGSFNRVDCLMGFNADEGAVFVSEASTEPGAAGFIERVFGKRAGEVIEYCRTQGLCGLNSIPEIVTYSYFKAGMLYMMSLLSDAGVRVFGYQFDFTPDGSYPMKQLGAHHAVDILYTFDSIRAAGLVEGEFDGLVAEQMHTMWCNFISHGDPNRERPLPDTTAWRRYDNKNKFFCYFDKQIESVPLKDANKIAFFEDILYGEE